MIVAIIQARMGSSRLPGKVMKNILGKPLIQYLLERVSKSKYIDKIILATTINQEDDVLAEYISSLGYEVFRGSESDVLSRYYEVFNSLTNMEDYSGIVRFTGDCPFVEPSIIEKVIESFIYKNYDHVCLSSRYAEGLDTEIFKPKLLFDAYNNANKLSEREHVMLYIVNNSDKYKMFQLENLVDDSTYRVTVDEEEDFIVVKTIIEEFYKKNIKININNIKKFLDENRDVFVLNSKVIRNEGLKKSLEKDKVIK